MREGAWHARQRAFFDEVLTLSGSATAVCGALVRDLDLAGRHIRLIFAGPALERRLMSAIDHLRADLSGEPDLVWHVWDSKSSGVPMVCAPVAHSSFSERGDIADFDSDRVRIAFQPADYSLSMFDVDARIGIYWIEEAESLPYWTEAAPFRTLFHWSVEQSGGVLVHGAVVGNGDGGVLITGKGGIGKSTTALGCLAAGFNYVGDDYVALYPGEEIVAHALYCTAKLNPDNAARFAAFAPRLLGAAAPRGEAKLVAFLPRGSNGVTSNLKLTAILTPSFADGLDSMIEPADPAAVLVLATATGLAQLPGAGAVKIDRVAEVVARLPGHRIRLGAAIDRIPPVIARLLRDPGQPSGGASRLADVPFLSLVVHAGGDATALADTFADILADCCPKMEAIVVDDGAPGLETMVEMLPFQPRIVRACGGDASGTAGATGEFVAVLTAGDRLAPGALQRILAMFRDDPELDAVAGAIFRRIPSTGRSARLPELLLKDRENAAPARDARELALGVARQALRRKRAIAS